MGKRRDETVGAVGRDEFETDATRSDAGPGASSSRLVLPSDVGRVSDPNVSPKSIYRRGSAFVAPLPCGSAFVVSRNGGVLGYRGSPKLPQLSCALTAVDSFKAILDSHSDQLNLIYTAVSTVADQLLRITNVLRIYSRLAEDETPVVHEVRDCKTIANAVMQISDTLRVVCDEIRAKAVPMEADDSMVSDGETEEGVGDLDGAGKTE